MVNRKRETLLTLLARPWLDLAGSLPFASRNHTIARAITVGPCSTILWRE
jgi:hypothetical protein